MPSKPIWMLRVIPFGGRREKAKVPVFRNIPVKGIERIQKYEKQPGNGQLVRR